jgi:hypothetical protein
LNGGLNAMDMRRAHQHRQNSVANTDVITDVAKHQ